MNVTFAADPGTAPARRDKKHLTVRIVDRAEMRVDNAINLQARLKIQLSLKETEMSRQLVWYSWQQL